MTKFLKFIFVLFLLLFIQNTAIADDYDFYIESINPPDNIYLKIECEISINFINYGADAITDSSLLNEYNYNFENFVETSIELPEIPNEGIENSDEFTYIVNGYFTEIGPASIYFEHDWGSMSRAIDIEVLPAKDFLVDSIEIIPKNPSVGQKCNIKIGIRNNGQNDLSTGEGLMIFTDEFTDFTITEIIYPDISFRNVFEVNEVIYYVFEGEFDSVGDKPLYFFIDDTNNVEESDEDNNEKEETFTVYSADERDIDIESIEVEGDLLVGSDVVITVSVENIGNVSISSNDGLGENDIDYDFDSFFLSSIIYPEAISLDNPFEPEDILEYEIYGNFNVSGSIGFYFEVDKHGDIDEADDKNNATTTEFIIYKDRESLEDFEIFNIEEQLISSSSIKILWETDKEVDCYVQYKNNNNSSFENYVIKYDVEWPESNDNTEHEVIIEDLEAGTKYYYEVVGENNTVSKNSDTAIFTMPEDNSIEIIDIESEVSDNEIIIAWTTNFLTSATFYYKKIEDSSYQSSSASEDLFHEIDIDSLDEGDYEFYIRSSGDSNNLTESGKYYFSIGFGDNEENEDDNNAHEEEEFGEIGQKETESEDEENNKLAITNQNMYNSLAGKIVLKVEENGEAYYVNPGSQEMYFLGRPSDAFDVMRDHGIGITNENLEKIPLALADLSGDDSDGDGLSDLFEDAIGTNKNSGDSDSDGYGDKTELEGGYSPVFSGVELSYDDDFIAGQVGRILLQVEGNGEAWYVNPEDGMRYFLGRPEDAFSVMRNLGLGISSGDFDNM